MSADADKLYQNFFSFNSSWSAPLQLAVALYLLYQQVADATWVGLASLLFSFVVLAVIFVRIAILERLRLKFSDVRVKLMNEMVQGIKIIKFMGWEGPILDEIERAREGELPFVRKIAYTKALMISFVLGTSIVVSIPLLLALFSPLLACRRFASTHRVCACMCLCVCSSCLCFGSWVRVKLRVKLCL